MTGVFLRLLNMSAAAAVVIVVVIIARLLLKRAPKKWSYLLWLAAAFRLCCPVSFGSAFSLFNLAPAKSAGAAFTPISVPEAVRSTAEAVKNTAGAALSTPQATISSAGSSVPTVAATLAPASSALAAAQSGGAAAVSTHAVLPTGVPTAPAVSAAAVPTGELLLKICAALWLSGLAIMLVIGIIRYIKLRRRVAAAMPLEGESGVYLTEAYGTPFILGLFSPRVYIPYGLTKNELSIVLAHERRHIKRGDNIAKALAYIILSVHWFNPFCWLAYYLMSRDMEMSCDERVIAEGYDSAEYGSTLLTFAARRRFPAPEPLAFGETDAKRRITNVLSFKKPKRLLTVAAALLCCAVLAACSLNAKQADGGEPSPTAEALQSEGPTAKATARPTLTPEPAVTADPTELPGPFEPFMYQPPERPRVVQTGKGSYHINEGEEPNTWGTTYYLTGDGRLYAFGSNQYGQIGDGSTEHRTDPQLVAWDVVSIRTGESRVFALKTYGDLWTWGIYTPWEGVIDSCGYSEPTQILSGVAEYDTRFALTESGELWATEHCENGELTPVKVMDNVRSFRSFEQAFGALIVTRDDKLYALYADYANNDPGNYSEPVFLADGIQKASAAFDMQLYAVSTEGKLLLFDNIGSDEVVELLDNVHDIYTVFDAVYAVRYDHSLWGFGDCEGWASMAYQDRPMKLLDDVKFFTTDFYLDEDLGWCYSFAIKSDNTLWAWGPNQFGELGVDEDTDTGLPVCVAEDVEYVTSDGFSTYIIKTDGSLCATGYNGLDASGWESLGEPGFGVSPDDARLGDGTRTTRHGFVKIMDNAESVFLYSGLVYIDHYNDGTDSSHSFSRTIAMTSGDEFYDCYVWGWGYNGDGCLMRSGEKYLLEPAYLGSANTTPPYYTVSRSERERYSTAANALLHGESVDDIGFTDYGQYVYFRLEDNGFKAYDAKVNYFKYVPRAELPFDSAHSFAEPIAVFPRELGERANRSLIENVRNYLGWDPADDADLVYQGFLGDDWFAFVTLDDSMQDLQTHCIFYNDNGEWREIKACPGVVRNGDSYCLPLTIFGACVTDANTAYVCYFTKQLWTEELGSSHPYVYRTSDGGETWTRLDIRLPDEYVESYCAPLSPVFEGRRGVMIISRFYYGESTIAWLETRDNGRTWEYHSR